MTERICKNCKHDELCKNGCAFFEEKEKEQEPFHVVSGPLGGTSYVFMRPGGVVVGVWEGGQKGNARAMVACDNLNGLWAGKDDDD